MYDEIAKGYDELYGEEQLRKLSLVRKYIHGKVLDLGAGTGIIAKEIDNVTSLEPCKEMLNFAPEPKVLGKAEEIPFEEGEFETIISFTALHHCDIDKVISELKRMKAKTLVLTILKKSKKREELVRKLKEAFDMTEIDEGKDIILVQEG
jgi:ubiquinone/menaquinone biosynthesis C-methylase UbiE